MLFRAKVVAPSISSLAISTIDILPIADADTSINLFTLWIFDNLPIMLWSLLYPTFIEGFFDLNGDSFTFGVNYLTSSTFKTADNSEAGD